MEIVTQQVMTRLFEVTDAIGLDREALTVPLAMEGEGRVTRLKSGRFEIALPAGEALAPFLAELPARLAEAGFEAGEPSAPE
ncbi:MAG: hypothetical protein HC897_08375 [Thermoanaerobaculia bacterium]|nr:hypothetical protein [Thermoanaerobaculia bacterium]